MAVRLTSVVVNCVDIERQVGFWRALLGVGEAQRVDGFFVWLEPQQPGGVMLAFQKVGDPTPGRRRLHLDLGVDDVDATAARVAELGGRHLEDHAVAGFTWKVMADLEGNEFCLAAAGAH